MKIVIAPDSYKESLSALEVAEAVARGFRAVFPDAIYRLLPVADGGEGTVEAMVAATGGHRRAVQVTGPLGETVEAGYGVTGDGATAIVEMAAASGLGLVPPARRDPCVTTSRGTGELILAVLDAGIRHLIVGIGGSATNDAGAGMLQALGVRLLDEAGEVLAPGGAALARLARIDTTGLDPRLAACRIEVACDVDNPLLGPTGASAVFGPQKGATPRMVEVLDAALARFAQIVERDMGVAVAGRAGAGAAGGMGAALMAFTGASLRPGIDIVVEAVGLAKEVADADLVITGEGRMDAQTAHGKTPVGVARVAQRHGKPVIGIAGSLGPGVEALSAHGINAVFSVLSKPCTLEEALREAALNVEAAARQVAATLALGAGLRA
ncbi:MAG: glycerate kinase [Rhodocyclaceae bacterium]